MKLTQKILSLSLLAMAASTVVAKPMPNSIIVDDKAVVPIIKTQIIRKVEGQEPVRTVEATIFEISNKGKDIVAREVVLQDNESTFSEKKMSTPVVKKGSVIVPTSKIELTTKVTQDGQLLAESKQIDAAGVEIKKDGEVIRKELKLDQISNPNANEKVTHAVVKEGGVTTRDVVVFDETETK